MLRNRGIYRDSDNVHTGGEQGMRLIQDLIVVLSIVGIAIIGAIVFGYLILILQGIIERVWNGRTDLFKSSIRSSKEDGEHEGRTG